jgi:putative pyruvate formate lyase activating enzyme
MLSQCQFCEHRCNINRTINGGFCLVSKSRIASEFIHQNEESFFIPSHTIFFSGCTLKCIFCQNWEISHLQSGIQIPPYEFANRIHIRKQQGSKNVNWVGGDPTPNIPYILKTLQNLDDWIPQIWNSNMYCSIEAMILLDGVIDVYLADHKFGNDRCASQLSQSSSYVRTIQRNLQIAYEQADLFIRHLILPNHISCCSLPILHWLKEFLPFSPINIMKQYRPCYHARNHPTINRLVTTEEYDKVLSVARTLQLNVV